MICMAEGGQKKGLPDKLLDMMSRGSKKQGSLFFCLLCIGCKFSDAIPGLLKSEMKSKGVYGDG